MTTRLSYKQGLASSLSWLVKPLDQMNRPKEHRKPLPKSSRVTQDHKRTIRPKPWTETPLLLHNAVAQTQEERTTTGRLWSFKWNYSSSALRKTRVSLSVSSICARGLLDFWTSVNAL